jgi:GST-like protein
MNIEIADYPNIHRWFNAIAERPAVIRGRSAEKLAIPQKYLNRKQQLSPEEWSNMFGDRMHNAVNL